ncbi:ABC transporter ATP-binding protein [Kribbella sp. NPDC056861]|uniref:ABC transporter ATP-binding protein n=1 Tax=Kribbella sp. NPDC056861 TaxID=3154857 RepID=UPI00343FB036
MRDHLRTVPLWFATAFRAAPLHSSLSLLLWCLRAVTAPISTYGVKLVVDGVAGAGEGTIRSGILLLVGASTVLLLTSFAGYLRDATADRVERAVVSDILRLTTHIPGIEHHERPDVADRLSQLRDDARELGYFAVLLIDLLSTVVNVALVLALLCSVHPVFAGLILLAFGQVWAAGVSTKWRQEAAERMQPHNRLVRELIAISKDPRQAVELRVFGLGETMLGRIQEQARMAAWHERRGLLRGVGIRSLGRIVFRLGYLAAVVYLIVQARRGAVSVGDLALVVLLAPQVDGAASEAGESVTYVGQALRQFGVYRWLRDYARDHAWEDSVAAAPERLREGIELRGVSFSYPGTDERVLESVDLMIPAGTSVALVGANGAGKSTLVKLLSRMYDPTAGQILVDGVPLSSLDPESWRGRLSAGYQDFVRYEFTAREVVGLGDLARVDDDQAIRTALARGEAEAVVAELPTGLDTQLGTQFAGSAELSGGQWQRLALARAFLRERPLLLLLDEPTAALDPEAEHALYERFAEASKETAALTGGITVLVSHRFSTVRMADLIVVIDDGRLVEAGSHRELLAAGGRYAELFEVQARAYR